MISSDYIYSAELVYGEQYIGTLTATMMVECENDGSEPDYEIYTATLELPEICVDVPVDAVLFEKLVVDNCRDKFNEWLWSKCGDLVEANAYDYQERD